MRFRVAQLDECPLTPTERETTAFAASGLSTREIAEMRRQRENGVKSTLANARNRLGAVNTCHLIAITVYRGWLVPEEDDA